MKKLLKMAKKVSDQAEIYSIEIEARTVMFENKKLYQINQAIQSGITLRIIKDGILGFSYTKNLEDRGSFVQNALDSFIGGAEAPVSFSKTLSSPSMNTWGPSAKSITSGTLADECLRIFDLVKERTIGQLSATATFMQTQIRILNSMGADLNSRSSEYNFLPKLFFPGSFAQISRLYNAKTCKEMPDESIEHLISLFNAAKKEARPRSGNMKVLFLPETLTTLLMRIVAATSGQTVFHRQSPLKNKINKKIFDEKFSIQDTPLADKYPGARAFDDEGTVCQNLSIVDKGVLKNFYTDCLYAKKLGTQPTGHGYKTGYTGDPLSFKPAPVLRHLAVEPGHKSLSEMIASMDNGIIVASDLGGHAGNIPAGDFSIGLSPGLYVQNGEITGHIKDAMVTGNIYDTLNKIIDLEDQRHYVGAPLGGMGVWRCPAILVDDVRVATKQG